MFIDPSMVNAPTPDVDGRNASKKLWRHELNPFDSIDIRRRADEYLYKLIVKTFKNADWQLRFQQKLQDDDRGAACLQLLTAEFDPKNLSTAIVATYAFLNASYTASTLEKHCNEMRSQFLKIKAMYFDKSTRKPDWEKMAIELCATAFIRSLPEDMSKSLQEAMNKLDRKFFTFEKCMDTALEQKRQGTVNAPERQFSAYAAPMFTPETFAAFLTGSISSPAGLMCTNCGIPGHMRKECPKKCRIPLPGGKSGDCNGIAPHHHELCMLHPTNVQARREALKREREAKRTDRRGTQPPPAYARQRNRRFSPKMQQQARANLVKLQGVKAQIMSSLVAATDQPSREFFQTQLNTADNEIVQCNLVLQQAAEDEAMDVASANLGKLYASESDEDFEDRACFDDLVKLDDVTDDAQPACSTESAHGQHARPNATSAWFVPDRPTSRTGKFRGSVSGLVKVLMAASALSFAAGASAFVAPPPMQTFSNGNLATFDGARAVSAVGKILGKAAQSTWSPTATSFPGLPPSARIRSCIVDSGCSIHMFSDQNQLSRLVPSHVKLQTADKKQHSISQEGIGHLRAIDRSGAPRTISIGRTLHTPGMHDLLSCCGVLDDGGVVHLEGNNSYIKLRDNTVFPVHRRGRLFYLDYIGSADSAGGANSTVAATTMVRPPNGLPSAGKIGVGQSTSADDVAQSLSTAPPTPSTTPSPRSAMPAPTNVSNVQPPSIVRNDLDAVQRRIDDPMTSFMARQKIERNLVLECASLGISTLKPSPHWGLPLDYSIALCAPARLSGIVQKLRTHYNGMDLNTGINLTPTAQLDSSFATFDCDEAGLPHSGPTLSDHQAFVNSEKQVSSGRVHGVETETASTEVVNVEGTPVFDAPMQKQSLWHRRCAHADCERINNSVNITHGLCRVHTNRLCQCCVYSKQASKRIPPAPVVRRAAHEPLAQVSVDLTQFSCPSLQGSKYLIVFVDTYSRYTWCKPLKSKSETSKALREFIQNVGCPREILSDWGTEFFGNFSQVCLDNYIRQVRSAPFSPFSNGIVERKNREIKGMIRSMLLESGGHASWWARAAIYATHIHNRLYSTYTPNATPYELMWGSKPDLSHLRVFGSVCYPLVVPASKRVAAHPLKYPSSCGIFLGYAENCPGAVCLDPATGKLSVRRDLVVDENYRFHRPTVGAPSLHHINPAINAPVPAPVELVPISDAVHVPPPKQLHDTASRYVIDVCAGTSSALRYHLRPG